MVLIDAGPLIALIDKADPTHQNAVATFRSFKTPPLTTWPCLTEAFYFIGNCCGWPGQKALLSLLAKDALRVHAAAADELRRISELMEQYHDNPMDFADASLVTLAELQGLNKVFTIDSGFYVFRLYGKSSFEVLLLTPS